MKATDGRAGGVDVSPGDRAGNLVADLLQREGESEGFRVALVQLRDPVNADIIGESKEHRV